MLIRPSMISALKNCLSLKHYNGKIIACYPLYLGQSTVQLATHLLQFVFLSVGGFRFPLAHFPTKQCPPSILYLQFWEGVMQTKRAGFT